MISTTNTQQNGNRAHTVLTNCNRCVFMCVPHPRACSCASHTRRHSSLIEKGQRERESMCEMWREREINTDLLIFWAQRMTSSSDALRVIDQINVYFFYLKLCGIYWPMQWKLSCTQYGFLTAICVTYYLAASNEIKETTVPPNDVISMCQMKSLWLFFIVRFHLYCTRSRVRCQCARVCVRVRANEFAEQISHNIIKATNLIAAAVAGNTAEMQIYTSQRGMSKIKYGSQHRRTLQFKSNERLHAFEFDCFFHFDVRVVVITFSTQANCKFEILIADIRLWNFAASIIQQPLVHHANSTLKCHLDISGWETLRNKFFRPADYATLPIKPEFNFKMTLSCERHGNL